MERISDIVTRHWRHTLFAIFIVAFLIRGIFILTLQNGFYYLDSVSYSGAAVNLLTTGELGQTYHRPPGYPVFLAAIYFLFGESIFAIRIAESLMGALLAVVIASIARRVGGEVVGALAGLLWSIFPMAVFITGLVYPTGLTTMLLACAVICFLPGSHQDPSPKRVFLGGVFMGLAALNIPIVIATTGAISLWLIYWSRAKRRLLVCLLLLGASLTVVPWMIRDYRVYGRLVLVEPRVVEHLPKMTRSEEDFHEDRIQGILNNPTEFAVRYVRMFVRYWKLYPEQLAMASPEYREQLHEKDSRVVKDTILTTNNLLNAVSILSTGPLFLFAVIGTIAMWFQREQRRELSLLWATILSFALVYSMFWVKIRYRFPSEPYIIILSAYGITKTWVMISTRLKHGVLSHKGPFALPKQS